MGKIYVFKWEMYGPFVKERLCGVDETNWTNNNIYRSDLTLSLHFHFFYLLPYAFSISKSSIISWRFSTTNRFETQVGDAVRNSSSSRSKPSLLNLLDLISLGSLLCFDNLIFPFSTIFHNIALTLFDKITLRIK